MSEHVPGESSEAIDDSLPQYTLEGQWELVKKIYLRSPHVHTTTIDEANGTALHVAVEMNEEETVGVLVKAIREKGPVHAQEALKMTDERGDTPLHIAASRGFARMCECIIGAEEEQDKRMYLLTCRNRMGETPLFLAAINWRKRAFAYLSTVFDNFTLFDLVRDNGDSILHCAIQREYFDLAVIIVHHYDILIHHRNAKGFTPLKVLATRPSAFRSASHLPWWKEILYYCIPVEPVKVGTARDSLLKKMRQKKRKDSDKMNYPKNYATCYDLFYKSGSAASVVFGSVPSWLSGTHKGKGEKEKDAENPQNPAAVDIGFLPPNYETSQQFVRSAYIHTIGLSGAGLKAVKKMKQKHLWSRQLLDALMKRPYAAFTGSGGRPIRATDESTDQVEWAVDPDAILSVYRTWKQVGGGTPPSQDDTKRGSEPGGESTGVETAQKGDTTKKGSDEEAEKSEDEKEKESAEEIVDEKETPFLAAARNGIVELVDELLIKIPSAIHNTNSKKENVLLVAVTHRQPYVVKALRRHAKSKPEVWSNLLLGVDESENTLLHLGAEAKEDKPWRIPGAALQMMWDIKWFQYIKSLAPHHFHFRTNKNNKTAGDVFLETHKDLVTQASEWMKDTSESCSVVAGLIAGVSFATASTVPGGTEDNGRPVFEGQPAFDVFAISSLIGLCFSVTALIMFLSILTSRKQAQDFRRDLPLKILLGLSSLFVSIAAMFVSFCTGHFFVLRDKYRQLVFPIYAATCLPVSFYAVAQFPLYADLLRVILPHPGYADDEL